MMKTGMCPLVLSFMVQGSYQRGQVLSYMAQVLCHSRRRSPQLPLDHGCRSLT